MGRPSCILTKPSTGKLDVCQERQQRPKKSCHKCAGTLLKAHASEVAHCRVCNAGYHTSDCGLRYFAGGLDEVSLHECPKCSKRCACSGGSIPCHTASMRLREKARKGPDGAHTYCMNSQHMSICAQVLSASTSISSSFSSSVPGSPTSTYTNGENYEPENESKMSSLKQEYIYTGDIIIDDDKKHCPSQKMRKNSCSGSVNAILSPLMAPMQDLAISRRRRYRQGKVPIVVGQLLEANRRLREELKHMQGIVDRCGCESDAAPPVADPPADDKVSLWEKHGAKWRAFSLPNSDLFEDLEIIMPPQLYNWNVAV